jgi:methyltransferase (TIGR00027 family)
MQNQQASRTAEYMAFFRALETMEPPRRRLFTDPYAFPLLSGPLRSFALMARFPVLGSFVRIILDLGWPYTRSSGVIRTRAIDDFVNEAIRSGSRQLVLLGAGFDSRAYRLREPAKVLVFEVDHPVTQQAKQQRLKTLTGRLPASVQFVPVDFEKDDLESKLIQAGFNPEVQAVVVWEGVISYLTESAVENTFALLSRLLAPASRLIFTYMHKGAIDGSEAFPGAERWRSWVRFSGEPFLFGFDPDTLAETVRPFGFLLESEESTQQIGERYCGPIGRKEPGSQAYRVAAAVRAEV